MPTKANKPAKPATAKRAAAKPAKPATAKPANAAPADKPAIDIGAERKAATDAIRSYYSGASLPFKAASDKFAPFRTDKAPKRATERQAALVAAMLLAGDNIQPNGNFVRGGFTFDGRNVQPETGCLSDMHGRIIKHVSGPLAGKQARESVFNIDLATARAEISAHLGDKLAKPALAKLDKLLAA